MMRRVWFVVVCFIGATVFASAVQDLGPGLELGNLRPEEPGLYLELGELAMLDAGLSPGLSRDRGFEIELLVRAVYWADRNGEDSVASSGCIALAELVESDMARLWLWDLALLLDPSRENEWSRMLAQRKNVADELDMEAAQCLYAIRYHQQPLGAELFARPEVRARVLEAAVLGGIDRVDLIRVLELEIERGREDSCRGRLYVVDRSSPGRRLACPDHLRGLGMCANNDELRMMLLVEMMLSSVEVESWGAAASMSMDGAINLPTVTDLVRLFRVEVDKAFYRDGRWVATP
ncbi:MAG: hypothetical protein JKY43_05940 [Phycisphaerales bacterium]|nr:hypothetical protein [Phycisphaerales bacterium]